MRILILGATGRTGRHVLGEALKQGYEVTCLVRSPQKLASHQEDPNLSLIEGNPGNKTDLKKASMGCSYIISALNISRKSDFPWSPLRTPKTLLSDVLTHLLSLSQERDFEKLVICSAWGVHETQKDIPWWFRLLIQYSNIGVAYRDHERQENVLTTYKDIPWTLVRPVGLIDRSQHKEVRISYDNYPKPYLTISRKEVGKFMVDALKNSDLSFKKPVVSSALWE